MDFTTSAEYDNLHGLDPAYSPQIVNEQGNGQPDEHQNGHPQGSNNSPMEVDSNSRYNSPNLAYQQPNSRPGSGMSGPQTQYQDGRQPQQPSKSSVVIKVGMVGDAQIGKTSLMVKYVEGSWDEDYIQTLGMLSVSHTILLISILTDNIGQV
jgi:GTP-binding protein of the ras superfamily involved in termination of M-phase